MEQKGSTGLDFTKQEALPRQEPVKAERLSNDELTPLDAQILDVVSEINRLEPMMRVPMVPSEAEKVEKAFREAVTRKAELLDRKFAIAQKPEPTSEGPVQDQDLVSLRLSRNRTDSTENLLQ